MIGVRAVQSSAVGPYRGLHLVQELGRGDEHSIEILALSALMVESLEAQVDSRMPRTVLLSVARVRGVRQMVACLILRCPSPQVWRKP